MDDGTTARPGMGRMLYESVLGLAAGFSLGWFAWLIGDRFTDDALPFWPFAVGGIIFGVTIVRFLSSRRSGRRWVHLLWIPVVLFVVLMTAVIMALRAWGS
jgi:hypothetical protein